MSDTEEDEVKAMGRPLVVVDEVSCLVMVLEKGSETAGQSESESENGECRNMKMNESERFTILLSVLSLIPNLSK